MSEIAQKIRNFGDKDAASSTAKAKTLPSIQINGNQPPAKAAQSQPDLPVTASMLSERAYILECGY